MNDLHHLLNRTSYGITDATLADAERLGYEGFVDAQLDYESLDDSLVDDLLPELFPTLSMSLEELYEHERQIQEGELEALTPAIELIAATLIRQLLSQRQLYELMVEFWSNHFNVYLFDGPVSWMKTAEDRDVMRKLGMGKFGELLHADAASPAMIWYLDNYANQAGAPQENYARELMELHTIGVDGGYDETDVKEVARCFSGWTISDEVDGYFVFYPPFHDTGAKTVLGMDIPADGGIEDGERVLDFLAGHANTATYVATKLIRRFVNDEPSPALVETVADRFQTTNGDIRETLRTLLLSSEFRASAGQKFKRPGEFMISALRSLSPNFTDAFLLVLIQQLLRMNHLPFYWDPPTGYPDVADHWISSAGLLVRTNLAVAIAQGEVPANFRDDEKRAPASITKSLDQAFARSSRSKGEPSGRAPVMGDVIQLPVIDTIGDARTPTAIVDRLIPSLLRQTIEPDERQLLIDYASAGLEPDQPLPLSRAVEQARGVIALLLGSRHFQYR